MEFAKKQLEKFGWVEGQGLGREKNGISTPIKVTIKRDAGGVGLSPGEEFNHWWSDVFNRAAQNIAVTTNDEGVQSIERKSVDESSHSITAKHYGNHRKSLLYGGFLDSSCTYSKETTSIDDKTTKDSIHVESLCERRSDVTEVKAKTCDDDSIALKSLTDDELLKACGGRTAHKAARHGLKLNGKLKRIQEQEKELERTTDTTDKDISEPLTRTCGSAHDSVQKESVTRTRKRKRTKDSNSVRKRKKD